MKKLKCSKCRYYNIPYIFNKYTNYCEYAGKYMLLDIACSSYKKPLTFFQKIMRKEFIYVSPSLVEMQVITDKKENLK